MPDDKRLCFTHDSVPGYDRHFNPVTGETIDTGRASPEPMPEDEQFLKVFYADGKFIGIPMSRLRALLATQGLAIVDEASAKVLEAELRGAEKDLRLVTENNAGHVARMSQARAKLEKYGHTRNLAEEAEVIASALELLKP